MYVIENSNGEIVKEISGATSQLVAEDITDHFRNDTLETHYLLNDGIIIYTAYASGYSENSDNISMWDDEDDYYDPDDYDDDYYDDEPYDPFDEVGYNPYLGGYDGDL